MQMELCGSSWRPQDDFRSGLLLVDERDSNIDTDFTASSSYRKWSEANDVLTTTLTEGDIQKLLLAETILNVEMSNMLRTVSDVRQTETNHELYADLDKNLNDFDKYRQVL
jgi:hypothetical protein